MCVCENTTSNESFKVHRKTDPIFQISREEPCTASDHFQILLGLPRGHCSGLEYTLAVSSCSAKLQWSKPHGKSQPWPLGCLQTVTVLQVPPPNRCEDVTHSLGPWVPVGLWESAYSPAAPCLESGQGEHLTFSVQLYFT